MRQNMMMQHGKEWTPPLQRGVATRTTTSHLKLTWLWSVRKRRAKFSLITPFTAFPLCSTLTWRMKDHISSSSEWGLDEYLSYVKEKEKKNEVIKSYTWESWFASRQRKEECTYLWKYCTYLGFLEDERDVTVANVIAPFYHALVGLFHENLHIHRYTEDNVQLRRYFLKNIWH